MSVGHHPHPPNNQNSALHRAWSRAVFRGGACRSTVTPLSLAKSQLASASRVSSQAPLPKEPQPRLFVGLRALATARPSGFTRTLKNVRLDARCMGEPRRTHVDPKGMTRSVSRASPGQHVAGSFIQPDMGNEIWLPILRPVTATETALSATALSSSGQMATGKSEMPVPGNSCRSRTAGSPGRACAGKSNPSTRRGGVPPRLSRGIRKWIQLLPKVMKEVLSRRR